MIDAMRMIPVDPLSRFIAIAKALAHEKRWWDDRTIIRQAALPLVMSE